MKKWMSMVLGMVLILGLAACGGGNENGGNESSMNDGSTNNSSDKTSESSGEYDAEAARATYEANCLSCHGENLQGKVGPGLTAVGSSYSKDEILNIIQNGKGQMPGNILRGDTEKEENVAKWLADMK
ncbi:c-type cytochrome [Guptibacillus hwajinpoensis]|uniref:Cytochrome c551 n=2 Tax=Guptibacillus hwajinpoensis TaxID=208199 RepID=A0ABU0K8S3_9BACL|nr:MULTISPECIES: cytochrome c [Alkalihalobacillus]MDP4552030.1 cytochrome c [Alkalihalobacillus macyae]MDQ0484748.1 cytochrome c551 [Alkalihalobacillus hemicentroti]